MRQREQDVRRWAGQAWPERDWRLAELRHGAFHEVLVLPGGPVARLTEGLGHQERAQKEAEVMSIVAGLPLPVAVPRPLAAPVSVGGRSGQLTSLVTGRPVRDAPWSQVRDQLTGLLTAFGQVSEPQLACRLPVPRAWCGGTSWPDLVHELLVPRLPLHARAPAARVVADVLQVEALAEPHLVHGDVGLHNLLWSGDSVTGLIDVDGASWADPAIDVAPLVGTFGVLALAKDVAPEVLQRAMHHRATLPLQVAAAADLAGRAPLRDHALANFARRQAEGTLHDPSGAGPAPRA